MQAKVGTFDCPSGTGNSAVTGIGFQPQAVIFFYNPRTSDGSSPGAAFGLGMATSPTDRFAWGTNASDNVGTAVVQRAASQSHCIRLVTNDAATTGLEADFVSFDVDGFTLNWTIVVNGADIHYIALAGLSNAKCLDFVLPTSTGSASFTGAGFEGDAALFLHSNDAVTDSAGGADFVSGLGVRGSATNVALGISNDDGSGSAGAWAIFRADRIMLRVSTIGVASGGAAQFTSFDSDGFTLNVTNAWAVAAIANGLILKGVSSKAGILTVPGGTGNQAISGLGFIPKAIIFFGPHGVTGTSAIDGFGPFFGAASSTTDRSVISAGQVDASDPVQNDYDSDTTKVIKALTAGTPTVDYAADLNSFDADGFTLNWSTVSGSDEIAYLAIGDAPGSATKRSFAVMAA